MINFCQTSAQCRQIAAQLKASGQQTKEIAFFPFNAGMWFGSVSAPVTIRRSLSHQTCALQGSNCHFATRWSVPWIDYVSTITMGRRRKGGNFSLWVVTPVHTLVCCAHCCERVCKRKWPAGCQSEHILRFPELMTEVHPQTRVAVVFLSATVTTPLHLTPDLGIWRSRRRLPELLPNLPTHTHGHHLHPPMSHPAVLHPPTPRGAAISWAEPFCTSLISTQDRREGQQLGGSTEGCDLQWETDTE